MKKQKYESIEKKAVENNMNDSENEQVLESISNFLTEEKKEKRQLDICPYCGGKMELRFKTDEDYTSLYSGKYGRHRGKFGADAYMYCSYCMARSPEFIVKPWMIDMGIVMEHLNKLIDKTIEVRLADEEEESDDE